MAYFNLSKEARLRAPQLPVPEGTPHRIKDRGIKWEETYRDRSAGLKRKFEKKIGPQSYFRWEGHDNYTDSNYFVVVGPAITKGGKKQWFAGIKKLPKDERKKQYAPSGEYFSNLRSALGHVSNKWAVKIPRETPEYDQETLRNVKIPRHVKG